jgi:hypothetical protein
MGKVACVRGLIYTAVIHEANGGGWTEKRIFVPSLKLDFSQFGSADICNKAKRSVAAHNAIMLGYDLDTINKAQANAFQPIKVPKTTANKIKKLATKVVDYYTKQNKLREILQTMKTLIQDSDPFTRQMAKN